MNRLETLACKENITQCSRVFFSKYFKIIDFVKMYFRQISLQVCGKNTVTVLVINTNSCKVRDQRFRG